MKLELKSDLPLETQKEIDRISALAVTARTANEAAFLTSLSSYLSNVVIDRDASGLILRASGVTIPTGYEGFKKGAFFIKTNASSNGLYSNTGNETSAVWDLVDDLAVDYLIPAVNMREFNDRGPIAASTTYNKWDIAVYQGRRILITNTFTTGSGTAPFVSGANYVKLEGVTSVKAADFGVVGDGSTDNTTALQNAINYAYAVGGVSGGAAKVILPYGYVMVSNTIEIFTGVFLEGQGSWATILKLMTNSNCHVIKTHKSTNGTSDSNAFFCGILDMTVDGNKANQNGAGPYHGIVVETNPYNVAASGDQYFDPSHVIQNVRIYRAKGDGIWINGRSDIRVIGVKSVQCDGNGFTSSFDTHFIGCISESAGLAGFYSGHGSIQFVNCKSFLSGRVSANDGHGFFLETASEMSIVNCDAQQNSGHGFYSKNNKSICITGCTNAGAGYGNTGEWSGLMIEGSQKSIFQVTNQSATGQLCHALDMITGSQGAPTNNHIIVTHNDDSGSKTAINNIVLTNNNIVLNGVSQTATLAALIDANISSPSDLQGLVYDGASGKWKNSTLGAGNFSTGIFGDGSDGAVNLDGTNTYAAFATKSGNIYTLSRDCFPSSLIIAVGVTLKCPGHRIFCTGAVTNHGTISNDGNDGAANGTAGANTGNNTLAGGLAGGAGNTGAGSGGSNSTSACLGVGSGGAGGLGSGGAGGAQGFAGNTGAYMFRAPQSVVAASIGYAGATKQVGGAPSGGGGGGDTTNKGGGGGGGGGAIAIFAHSMTNDGTLSAKGGNGGTPTTGNCGGGGGGGGGLILIYTLTAWANTGTTNVAGGTGGTAVGTGVNGGNGGNGSVTNFVLQ